jgi:hypothetical protein
VSLGQSGRLGRAADERRAGERAGHPDEYGAGRPRCERAGGSAGSSLVVGDRAHVVLLEGL